MRQLIAQARRLWPPFGRKRRQAVLYEVACSCGRAIAGERQTRHQVVPCPGCGNEVFVLPRSPCDTAQERASPRVSRLTGFCNAIPTAWRWPILAALATSTAVIGLCLWLLRPTNPAPTVETVPPAELMERYRQAARQAITDGEYGVAARELAAACKLREQQPRLLSPQEGRQLIQLRHEVEAREHWLARPLPLYLDAWKQLDAKSVQLLFDDDVRGKVLVLDIKVSRDATGRFAQPSPVAGLPLPKMNLAELKLLEQRVLTGEQRLILGAKLAALVRDDASRPDDVLPWRVTFQPDSGVFLTDPAITAACRIVVDDEVRGVLERQQGWSMEGPK